MSFYDYSVTDAQGNEVSMENYRGKVVLVVNTATTFTSDHPPNSK